MVLNCAKPGPDCVAEPLNNLRLCALDAAAPATRVIGRALRIRARHLLGHTHTGLEGSCCSQSAPLVARAGVWGSDAGVSSVASTRAAEGFVRWRRDR